MQNPRFGDFANKIDHLAAMGRKFVARNNRRHFFCFGEGGGCLFGKVKSGKGVESGEESIIRNKLDR